MPRKQPSQDAPEDGTSEAAPSRSFWSGTLSFGLVAIPVQLYSANRSVRTSMRMLAPDGTPLARRYFAPDSKQVLAPEQIERGYEIEKGEIIPIRDEELEALAPEQSRDIDLTRFVPEASIAPLYFERSYFLIPSGSNLAYRLLATTMQETKRAGIATFVMRGKQYLVAIVADHGLLRAETLRFQEELRTPAQVGLPAKVSAPAATVKRVRTAIKQHTKSAFARGELEDVYWQRLTALVEEKRKKHEDVVRPEAEVEAQTQYESNVIDLMAVLKRSLAGADAAEPKPVKPKKRAAKKATTRTKRASPRPASHERQDKRKAS